MHSGKFTIARIATIAGHWFPYDRNDRQWVATIAVIELTSISAIVVATVAEEWCPYDPNNRWTFLSDRRKCRDRSDHMRSSASQP